jgi:osmotically-inducible protein OsmY
MSVSRDTSLTDRANVVLQTTDGVHVIDGAAATTHAVVTLRGRVSTAAQRAKAGLAVASIDGVLGVRNLLEVVEEPETVNLSRTSVGEEPETVALFGTSVGEEPETVTLFGTSVGEEPETVALFGTSVVEEPATVTLSGTSESAPTDNVIKENVEAALRINGGRALRGLKVTGVDHGVVHMSGKGVTMTGRLRAVELAWDAAERAAASDTARSEGSTGRADHRDH